MPESFQYNSSLSNIEIEDKIKRLAEDVTQISTYKVSNKLFANYDLVYPITFYSNFTLEDFLCRPSEVKKNVDRDVVNALQNVFQRASSTSISSQEVIEVLLPLHDKNICHGLIAFYEVSGLEENLQLVYGIDCWYKFRRYFLGLYPNLDTFIDECTNYFPKLYFHSRTKYTIAEILSTFSVSIVKHLEYLNDTFYTYRNRTFTNESVKYQSFTAECNLDENAAPKDNNDAKQKLTFDFFDEKENKIQVSCFPHLRLSRSDKYPGDSQYYFNRIYFHEGISSIKNGNILIGHIGTHL